MSNRTWPPNPSGGTPWAARSQESRGGWERWVLGALLCVHALLAWIARAPGVLTSQDDAWYILLARSLRAFQYADVFLVDAPPHRMYPPGFPAAIAVWSAIGGERFDWLVLLSVCSSLGTLTLTYLTMRRLFGVGAALACLAALAANPAMVERAGQLESEALYTFTQSLTIWALSLPGGGVPAVVVGLAAALATSLVRSIGGTMVVALAVWLLWRGHWRMLASVAVMGLLITGGWMAWTAAAPDLLVGTSYLADALGKAPDVGWGRALAERLRGNLVYAVDVYWLLPAPTIGGTVIDNAIGGPILGASLLGGLVAMAVRLPLAFAYLVVYTALLLLWPFRVGRFLIPLLPLLISCTVVGSGLLGGMIGPRAGWLARAVVTAALAGAGVFAVADIARFNRGCTATATGPTAECLDPHQVSFFEALRYLRSDTPPDAVLLSGKQATVYFYSGRRLVSLGHALAQPPDTFVDFLRREEVSYVLLPSAMRYGEGRPTWGAPALGDLAQRHCAALALERVFAPGTVLLRVPAVGEATDAAATCAAVAAQVTVARSVEARRDAESR